MKRSVSILFLALLLPLTGKSQVEKDSVNQVVQELPTQDNSHVDLTTEELMDRIPEGLVFLPDIAYREGSEAWKLDLVMPEERRDGRYPALIMVHGGGWRGGDKRSPRFFEPCIEFALKGYVCITVNYRLLGEADGIDDCIADVKCAVRWLRANAEEYNVDPDHLGAFGNSAGAHLVAMLGLCPESAGMEGDGPYQEYSSMVQAVVAGATPANFMIPMSNRRRPAEQEQQNQDQQSSTQQRSWLRYEMPEELKKKISPVTYVNADAPPFLLFHEVTDPVVGVYQSDQLVEALKASGARDITYHRYEDDSGHAVFFKNIDETGPMREDFFARILRK